MFFAVYHTPRSSWIMLLQSGFLSPQDSSSQTQWQVFIPASLLYSYIEFGGGKNIRLCKSTLFSQVYTEGTKTFPQKSSNITYYARVTIWFSTNLLDTLNNTILLTLFFFKINRDIKDFAIFKGCMVHH